MKIRSARRLGAATALALALPAAAWGLGAGRDGGAEGGRAEARPAGEAAAPTSRPKPRRVLVTGEIIDTWCYNTGIMFAEGTAHHQCAVWCAVGGIPVSIKGDDGKVYMILRMEGDDATVAGDKLVTIQSHQVIVDGDLYVRDGVNYLVVDVVKEDAGCVNRTHDEYGIVPFGE